MLSIRFRRIRQIAMSCTIGGQLFQKKRQAIIYCHLSEDNHQNIG